MTYQEWLATVPSELTGDPLWKMKVYRLAVFLGDLAWRDVSKLLRDQRTKSLADQLYRAIGSVGANIAEGYSRRSGKDRARFYEYALGSAREARGWYYQGRHVLTEPVCMHRAQLLTEVIRLLLTITPVTRARNLAEETAPYEVALTALLDNPPIP
jgi:four helix bundle protein